MSKPMFASSATTAREYNRLLNAADRVTVYTLDEVGVPDGLTYDQTTAWLKDWMSRNDASYYAAPREKFSEGAARMKAAREGKTVVIVEDLS